MKLEQMMEIMPEEPEGLREWIDRMLPKAPIYYRNYAGRAECTCGKCNSGYSVFFKDEANKTYEEHMCGNYEEKPKRRGKARCKVCGHESEYEWKKVVRAKYTHASFWIFQRTKDNNLIARVYRCIRRHQQDAEEYTGIEEVRRYIFTLGQAESWRYESRWTEQGWRKTWEPAKTPSIDWTYDEGIYPGYEQELKNSNLKYFNATKFQEYWSRGKSMAEALLAYSENPGLEMYDKAGMEMLVNRLIVNRGKLRYINRRATTVNGQLRIKDKARIRKLIEEKGDISMLIILQQEEKKGVTYTEEQREFLKRNMLLHERDINKLLKYMTIQKLINRVEKYRGEKESEGGVIGKYADYIRMREELGYDMNNEVFIHPRSLKKAHDKMVKETNERKDKLHIAKKLKEFPNIANRYERLEEKYGYHEGDYTIRPARNAEEIIMEGRILHHCVGGDNYLRKHNKGESYILFLRKKGEEDTPFITIEIKKDKIVQWYGLYDKKPDKEKIEKYIEQYIIQLDKKAAKEVMEDGELLAAAV